MNKLLIFASGIAIGTVVTWSVTRKYYEETIRKEVKELKEHYIKKNEEAEDEKEWDEVEEKIIELQQRTKDIVKFESIKKQQGYDYSAISNTNKVNETPEETPETEVRKKSHTPYIISPDELGECDDYEVYDLTLYADGVIADDMDDIVTDVNEKIGFESLDHVGEYEDDMLFVRNDVLRCDYEISVDNREYYEVVGRELKPHQMEE